MAMLSTMLEFSFTSQSDPDAAQVAFLYGHHAIQGRRPYMEDRHVVYGKRLEEGSVTSFFGVFDGHGGPRAAEFCARNLCANVVKDDAFLTSPRTALVNGFLRTDTQFLGIARRESLDDGTTAVLAMLQNGKLLVANAGDSRCVLVQRSGKAVPLSTDHKPDRPEERERITSRGGQVVFWGVWRTQGVLAVSRALGDRMLKQYVTAEPEVEEHALSADDKFLVLASDGLWDVVSNDEVGTMLESVNEPKDAARVLVNTADQRGSMDNICVLVVDLRHQF